MDDVFHEMMTPASAQSKKRPVWLIAVIAAVGLAVVLMLVWLMFDPFAKPSYATFEDSWVTIDISPSVSGEGALKVEPNYKCHVRDHTPVPITFTMLDADLKEMSVTVGFSKPLLRDDTALMRVTLRYDETVTLVTEPDEEGETSTVTLAVELPRAQGDLEAVLDGIEHDIVYDEWTYTVFGGDGMTLTLFKQYYALAFDDGETAYGTYAWGEEDMILTENAGLTRYVFVRDGEKYAYDAGVSYRHKNAHTPALDKTDSLRFLYRFEKQASATDSTYTCRVYDREDTILLEEVSTGRGITTELIEPHVLCVTTYGNRMISQAVYGNTFVQTAQCVNLNTGEISKRYDYVLCQEGCNIAYAEERNGKAFVIFEPLPWSRDAARQALAVELQGVSSLYEAGLCIRAYVQNERLVVAYYGTANLSNLDHTVVALRFDGTPCDAPLLTCGEADTMINGKMAMFAWVDTVDGYDVMLFGVWSAYALIDGVYEPAGVWFDTYASVDAFTEKVLADIDAGLATRTSWENGAGFVACYGDERHNITIVHSGEHRAIYIGAVPTKEQTENMIVQDYLDYLPRNGY